MINAKEEFLELIGTRKVKCADINYESYGWRLDIVEQLSTQHSLKVGYSPQELSEFIDSLDFEYDSGYGTQELFGTIWFEMREWAEREEYDGSENWSIKSYPEIPENLKIK
jgi:hypothetical protein